MVTTPQCLFSLSPALPVARSVPAVGVERVPLTMPLSPCEQVTSVTHWDATGIAGMAGGGPAEAGHACKN